MLVVVTPYSSDSCFCLSLLAIHLTIKVSTCKSHAHPNYLLGLRNIDFMLLRLLFCFLLSAILFVFFFVFFFEGGGRWDLIMKMFVCHWWNGTNQLGVYTIVLFWCNQSRRNCLMIHDVVSDGPTAGRVASQQREGEKEKREYLIELHQFPLASCLFFVCVCFFSFSYSRTFDLS